MGLNLQPVLNDCSVLRSKRHYIYKRKTSNVLQFTWLLHVLLWIRGTPLERHTVLLFTKNKTLCYTAYCRCNNADNLHDANTIFFDLKSVKVAKLPTRPPPRRTNPKELPQPCQHSYNPPTTDTPYTCTTTNTPAWFVRR